MSDINLNNNKKPTNHITYEMENFFDYQGYSKKIKEFIKEKNQDLIPSFNNDKQLENEYHFIKKEDNIYSPHLNNFNQGKFNSIYNIDLNKNLFGYDKNETNYDENYNRYYKQFYGELNVTDSNKDNYDNIDNSNKNNKINQNIENESKLNNENLFSENNIPKNEFKQSTNIIDNEPNNGNFNFEQKKLYNNLNNQKNIPTNSLDYQNSNNNAINYNPKYTQSQQLEAEYNKMNYINNPLNNDNIFKSNNRFNNNNIQNDNLNPINSSQGFYPSIQRDNFVNQSDNYQNNLKSNQNQQIDNSNLNYQPFNNNNIDYQNQLNQLFDNSNNSNNLDNNKIIPQSQFESSNKNKLNPDYNKDNNQFSNNQNKLNPNQINIDKQFKDNVNQNIQIFDSGNLNNIPNITNDNYDNINQNVLRNQNQNNLNHFNNSNLNNIPNSLNQSNNIQNKINNLNKNISNNNLDQFNDVNNLQNILNQPQDSRNINLNQISNELNQSNNNNLLNNVDQNYINQNPLLKDDTNNIKNLKSQIPTLSLSNNIITRKSFLNNNKSNEENPLNNNIKENTNPLFQGNHSLTGENLTNITFTTTTNPLLTTTSGKGLKRRSILDTDENRKLLANPDEDGFSEMKVSNPFTRPDNHYVQKEKEYNARKGIKEKNLFEDETEDSQDSNLNNNIDYDIDSIINKPLILKSQQQNNLDNNKENINDVNNEKDNLNENEETEKKKKLKNFKSIHTLKIGKIQHLPLEQQILILYNENKQLTNELDRYKNLFGDIDALEGVEGIANQFKNLLIQENENLRNLNKEGEKIINEFIKFINSINEKLDRNKINIDDIRKNANNLAKFFSPLKHEIIGHINRSLKRKGKEGLSSGVSFDSKENLSDDEDYSKRIIEKLRKLNQNGYVGSEGNYMLNYYDVEHNTWIRNCLPCQLGYNQSSKGYSPIMCSPNYAKYVTNIDS